MSGTACTARTARTEQQDGVESHHCQCRDSHLVECANPAVPPDVDRARNAHCGQSDHEDAQPGLVVSRGREPQVHCAGNSCQGGANPGVQDRPGSPDLSCRGCHYECPGGSSSGSGRQVRRARLAPRRGPRCAPRRGPARCGSLNLKSLPARPEPGCGQRSLRDGA